MNRVNFAQCSMVIVDVCAKHGTWFDRDELHRIVEFIQYGGLQTARRRELQEAEEKLRRLKGQELATGKPADGRPGGPQVFDGLAQAASSIILNVLD